MFFQVKFHLKSFKIVNRYSPFIISLHWAIHHTLQFFLEHNVPIFLSHVSNFSKGTKCIIKYKSTNNLIFLSISACYSIYQHFFGCYKTIFFFLPLFSAIYFSHCFINFISVLTIYFHVYIYNFPLATFSHSPAN